MVGSRKYGVILLGGACPRSLNEPYAQLPLNGPHDNAYYLNILISASSGKSDRLMERIAPWSAAIAVHIVCSLFSLCDTSRI